MKLSGYEKKMLAGGLGPAPALALAILVDLGRAIGAPEMVEISHVHTDSGFYLGDAGLEFVEHLAKLGGRVAVPCSMNNTSFDIEHGADYGVSGELAAKIKRLETAHLAMGADPAWTCAPYQDGILPQAGQMVAWSESNAIAFANSVLGAWTNRTGDLVDICCALTGRAPKTGLYVPENRLAGIQITVEGFDEHVFRDERFYPLLGYFIGSQCGNKVAAVSGLPAGPSMDALKGLGAAAASSGATALFHLVSITPEAPDLAACLKRDVPIQGLRFGPAELAQAEELLWTAQGEALDWVGFGCPHFSLAEFRELVAQLEGRDIHPKVKMAVFSSRKIKAQALEEGLIQILEAKGVKVQVDGCLLLYPQAMKPKGAMMTNSAKAANYIFSQAGYRAAFGTIAQCVDSAVAGRVLIGPGDGPWS